MTVVFYFISDKLHTKQGKANLLCDIFSNYRISFNLFRLGKQHFYTHRDQLQATKKF